MNGTVCFQTVHALSVASCLLIVPHNQQSDGTNNVGSDTHIDGHKQNHKNCFSTAALQHQYTHGQCLSVPWHCVQHSKPFLQLLDRLNM